MNARALIAPAALLGFALSGFFDGILLHQILQWHHLLSATGGDLAFQVAADGWFHVGMYAIAAAGLGVLWRRRAAMAGRGAGRTVAAWGLIGFGLWHVVDAVLFHWTLGIHRIRMDAANRLAWDVGWLAATGLAPLLAGIRLARRPGGGSGRTATATLAVLAVASGIYAALPPPGGATVVAFAGGTSTPAALSAVARAGGTVQWSDPTGRVFAVDGVPPDAVPGLLSRGAIWVGGAGLPTGCLGWRA